MSVAAGHHQAGTTPALTLAAREADYACVRDHSYKQTALGPTVVDWIAWLELGGTKPRTLDQYERDLSRGCLHYPDTGIQEFGDAEMLQVARLFKPKGRRTRVAAWRSFFKWAIRRRLIVANPCDALPDMKREPRKVHDLFTDAEIAVLCGLPLRDGALMTLMFEAGPRKGDCRTFRLRNWRPEATPEMPYGSLAFMAGKGGKDRLVPAKEPVARALADLSLLEGLGPGDFLWYSRPGGGRVIQRDRPIGDASFSMWWRRCLADADVRYRNPHVTRHTFATRFLRNRGRLETLQLILGHESIQTTSDLYGHLDMRDVAADLGLTERVVS